MKTYTDYTESVSDALDISEADEIFRAVLDGVDSRNEDEVEFFRDFIQKSVKYASRRASWQLISRGRRMDTDDMRTTEHDAVIRSLNILARLLKSHGKDTSWHERLGDEKEHRKRIGDFACYVALFLGLGAR